MIYASREDIVRLYGEDALFAADRDDDAQDDAGAVTAALESASREIDSYLAVRHRLPLDEAPAQLIQPCVDIALYRMARSATALSDEDRTRFEDAIDFLTKLSKGHVELILPADEGADPAFEAPQPIVAAGPERIFSREKTRDL
ncbi:MAG: phage protein Gp36 family protein [Pseudomonadota bacterium]